MHICLHNLVAVTIDSSLSLLLTRYRRSPYTINDRSVSQEMNVSNSPHSPKDLDAASHDHGESSSTPINAISTKCSLSLVNEARRRGQGGKRGFVYDEDHCFLIT
ncbi:Uncharacterized protein DBV15_10915 [Temnothorax longispinosus]|uniref:Uncharacterized protein n=1 Tax=Temnothorax longispinosus TaxID=300112 RepID=A0A4S2KPY3_9HYME|nr:Uncharacterized protein DBV15_10915 [Temnothorax longispinosus]